MPELLKIVVETATAFPTIIFTVLLGLVVLYWIVSMVTGGGTDGAVEGMAEGLFEGLADGAMEGLADGALEGMADGALEGVADGAVEGLGEGAGSTLGRFLGCIGLTAVPVTLFLSMLVFFAWGLSILLTRLIGTHVGVATTSLVVGSIVAVTSLGLGVTLTAWAVRPLKVLFRDDKTVSRHDLVGKVCTLTTLKVTADFGMAEYDDGQARLLLQVRCRRDNNLQRGSLVRITGFDKGNDVLLVAPRAATQHDDNRRA